MKKKIYGYLWIVMLVCVFLTAVPCVVAFHIAYKNQSIAEIKNEAALMKKNLNYVEDKIDYLKALNLTKAENRVTLVDTEGNVLYDSYAPPSSLNNHLDRPEIKSAFALGFGESQRYSDTLGEVNYYYAVLVDDETVLRVSKLESSIYSIFAGVFPLICLIIMVTFIISDVISRKITKAVIEPINNINIDNAVIDTYDELSVFVNMINYQRMLIKKQLFYIEQRAETINVLIENTREGIVLVSKNERIISINKSAAELLDKHNYENAYYIDKNIIELTRNKKIIENVKTALNGTASDYSDVFGERIIHFFFNPVTGRQNGEITGVIILCWDMTDKMLTEKMRREFSANVSHELKTPLTSILGYSEIIDSGMVKEGDIPEFIRKIKSEVERLIALVNDIIHLSELDEIETRDPDVSEFDVGEQIKATISRLNFKAEDRKIKINVVCECGSIFGNPGMIDELIYNLVENSIKYNKEFGTINIKVTKESEYVVISVADSGIGIEKKHLDRIFERFYRVDKSRSKKTGGTGLGLSIVKHIAQYHGGHVEVESEIGKGTVMTVYLAQKQI